MSDDRPCGCPDLGALSYVEGFDADADELDLVLDEPDDLAALAGPAEATVGVDVAGFGVVGHEPFDLDGDDLGFLDDALDLGLKLGKKVFDAVSAPSKTQARRAQRKAKSAQQETAALKAKLKAAQSREAKEKRLQAVMEERRREQAHLREKKALQAQIKDLEDQQLLVRRQMGKTAADARELAEKAAAEKARQSRNRKLAIGGGVAATSLVALWALNRRPKAKGDDKEIRR